MTRKLDNFLEESDNFGDDPGVIPVFFKMLKAGLNNMKIMFVSLGCDKNLVDSEIMTGLLSERGYDFTDDESQADIIVVNTCCFINDAKEESINTLLSCAEMKKKGNLKAFIVAGCLAQRYREEIQKEIPEVDAVLGTTAIDEICDAVSEVLSHEAKNHYRSLDTAPVSGMKRILSTGGHYAYLKIADGCNKHCTYCIIPRVRGNFRSIPMEEILQEAAMLADSGVKELIIVAQETTLYGIDLYGKKSLAELLKKICRIPGIEWIRLLYCYPEEIDDSLIQVMKSEDKICHYLDMPVQHASDSVLKRMGRKTNQAHLRALIEKLRTEIPDICLRTTLITGFPGESQEDFEELYRFVNDMEFDRLGVFTYSQEEGTPAANMENQIPEDVKAFRRDELMELQQAIAFEKAESKIGRSLSAFIEGRDTNEDVYIARTYMDAPGVDGYLFLKSDSELMSGDFVDVKVTGSNEYDLIGEMEDEFTE